VLSGLKAIPHGHLLTPPYHLFPFMSGPTPFSIPPPPPTNNYFSFLHRAPAPSGASTFVFICLFPFPPRPKCHKLPHGSCYIALLHRGGSDVCTLEPRFRLSKTPPSFFLLGIMLPRTLIFQTTFCFFFPSQLSKKIFRFI